MARKRIGHRQHVATFERHNGARDESSGAPTYDRDKDWDSLVSGWYCEKIDAAGGETLRGLQVVAEATTVFYGEHFGGLGIKPTDRMTVGGERYSVVAVRDPDGTAHELRVEAKREVA